MPRRRRGGAPAGYRAVQEIGMSPHPGRDKGMTGPELGEATAEDRPCCGQPPTTTREQEGLTAFPIQYVDDNDRAVKASPTGGLRPALTALPITDHPPRLYLDASRTQLTPAAHQTNGPNRVGLTADTVLTKPAPSGMPLRAPLIGTCDTGQQSFGATGARSSRSRPGSRSDWAR